MEKGHAFPLRVAFTTGLPSSASPLNPALSRQRKRVTTGNTFTSHSLAHHSHFQTPKRERLTENRQQFSQTKVMISRAFLKLEAIVSFGQLARLSESLNMPSSLLTRLTDPVVLHDGRRLGGSIIDPTSNPTHALSLPLSPLAF